MRNWFIPFTILVLASISLITIKSIAPELLIRQAMFFVIGFFIFLILSKTNTLSLQKYSLIGYGFLIFLLVILLLIGQVNRGIVGWIDFGGGFRFQPSQLAIPLTAFFVITWLEKEMQKHKILGLVSFFKALFIIMIPGLLILIQPDLGTAIVYFFSLGIIFIHPAFPIKYLLSLIAMTVFASVFSWFFLFAPYQKDRITSFISISDPSSGMESPASYNARQSLIAVGSGQFFGKGLGQGIQSHLRFLPERQTDFIFASFAEEWGFIGSVLVSGMYLSIILFMLVYSQRFEHAFESIYSCVLALMFLIQAGINIGMNIGILPITGITLPLISYGGSSILAVMIMLGVFQGFIVRYQKNIKIWFA